MTEAEMIEANLLLAEGEFLDAEEDVYAVRRAYRRYVQTVPSGVLPNYWVTERDRIATEFLEAYRKYVAARETLTVLGGTIPGIFGNTEK